MAAGVAAVLQWLTQQRLDAADLLAPLVAAGLTSVAKLEAASAADLGALTPQQRKKVLAAVARTRGAAATKKRKAPSGAVVRDGAPGKRSRAQEIPGVDDLAEEIRVTLAPEDRGSEDDRRVLVNRSPVMILWGACAAQVLGFDWSSALSLGSAMAGLNARSHGAAIGIYQSQNPDQQRSPGSEPGAPKEIQVGLLGRGFTARVYAAPEPGKPPAVRGVTHDGRTAHPRSTLSSLQRSFGASLERVYATMKRVMDLMDPEALRGNNNRVAYEMYTVFRPTVAAGRAGWGAKGPLLLDKVESLATDARFPHKEPVAVKSESSSAPAPPSAQPPVKREIKAEKSDREVEDGGSAAAQGALLTRISRAGPSGLAVASLTAGEQKTIETLQLDGLVYERAGYLIAS